jgi:hypothetical protein
MRGQIRTISSSANGSDVVTKCVVGVEEDKLLRWRVEDGTAEVLKQGYATKYTPL